MPQGKGYIGCTGTSTARRWQKEKDYHLNSQIGRAVRQDGWEKFQEQILCEKLTKSGAEKLEKWFVEYYDSMNPERGITDLRAETSRGRRPVIIQEGI